MIMDIKAGNMHTGQKCGNHLVNFLCMSRIFWAWKVSISKFCDFPGSVVHSLSTVLSHILWSCHKSVNSRGIVNTHLSFDVSLLQVN